MKQRVWIIGGSSGIGLGLVKLWLLRDCQLVVSSRMALSNTDLLTLRKIYPKSLHLLEFDVSQTEHIENIINEAWSTYGGLDLWFYNAGIYKSMPLNEWNTQNFEQMTQTNYLGAVTLIKHLYPHFKAQKHGQWIFNISLSALIGLPYGAAYSAPKAALLNLAESIQGELQEENIQLQVINHGFVKTRLTDVNDFEMPQLMDVDTAAKKIMSELDKPYRFEITFPFALTFFLKLLRFLPYKLSLAITKKALK
jgi:short-subunit dehydrogenase